MKQASEAGETSEEGTAPQVRGWFQSPSRQAAADGGDPQDDDVTQLLPLSGGFRPAVSGPHAEGGDPRAGVEEPPVEAGDPEADLDDGLPADSESPSVCPDMPPSEAGELETDTSSLLADGAAQPDSAQKGEVAGPVEGSKAEISDLGAKVTEPAAVPDRSGPKPGSSAPRPDAGGRRLRRVFGSTSRTGVSAPRAGTADHAAESSDAAADKPTSKRSRSVFGPAPTSRPDMLTDAETVIMPSLKDPKGSKGAAAGHPATDSKASSAGAKEVAASRPRPVTTMTPIRSSAEFAEDATQILPTLEPPEVSPDTATVPARKLRKRERKARPASQPPERYTPNRRTTMVSRLVLLAILCLQAVLSLRLHNTAFEDESLYLYSGHMELEHLLHGSALYGGFASYFSGSPVLYPVAAAALDQVGGLAAARALSLFEMLAATALLYSLTRRLFNERIGLCAAGFFAVAESTIFLGNFATFDATCLSLLACAAWIVVRTAGYRWPVFLLAAPLAALAVAVKYAGLLFVPTIAVLPALAGWPERGRRVLWYPLGFGAVVAGLLLAALRLGGHAYLAAIQSTTTNRAQGSVPASTILREAAEWGGVLFALAVIGAIAYVWRVRTEPDEKIAPAGGRLWRAALGVVLTGTALLAPAYQAHLHTDISFLKHVGFGLFFAAPMAGFGLARIMGDYFRRPQFGVAAWSMALVLGMVQSNYLYHAWPSSSAFVSAFSKYLKPNALYLVEVPEVPMYYLEGLPDAQPKQFISTYSVPPLTTAADFRAVVKTGEFQVIAYTGLVTPANDQALANALAASHSYHLAAKVSSTDSAGPVTCYIWVKDNKGTSGSKAKKAQKADRTRTAS